MVPASQEPAAGMPEQQGKMPSEEQVGEKKGFYCKLSKNSYVYCDSGNLI